MRAREPLVVWALLAACWIGVLVTYARLPARELYNVTGSGLEGGAGRLLVYLNFPTALAAIPIVGVLYERLPSRLWRLAAALSVLLCLPVFWPGVVSQNDLDARPVNAVPALGVALALLLTCAASPARPARRVRGDRLRVVLAAVALACSPAWIAAEAGWFLDGVPVLGRLYLSGRYAREQPGLPAFAPAVHHGDHHGLDGVLLVLTALALSRLLAAVRRPFLRDALAGYLALLLAYGFGNIANDFWTEQVFKRDWAQWLWPSVLEPKADWSWLVLVLVAGAVWLGWFGRAEPATSTG